MIRFISNPKAGRTWIRVLLFKGYSLYRGEPEDREKVAVTLPGQDQFPQITFTHDEATFIMKNNKRCEKTVKEKIEEHKKHNGILFLARDPRDILVGFYASYSQPPTSLSEYAKSGMFDNLCYFHQVWNQVMDSEEINGKVITYEDFKQDTFKAYKDLLLWLNNRFAEKELNRIAKISVEYASFENMKRMEKQNTLEWGGLANRPKKAVLRKVRRGKVGGYVDDLSAEDINYCNEIMNKYRCNIINKYVEV